MRHPCTADACPLFARKGIQYGARVCPAQYERWRIPSRVALRELEGHSGDLAHVDADGRQGSPETLPAGKSLVECDVLCHRPRHDDLGDALSRPGRGDTVRLRG